MTNKEMNFNSLVNFFQLSVFCSRATANTALNGSVVGPALPVTSAVGESKREAATGFYETLRSAHRSALSLI